MLNKECNKTYSYSTILMGTNILLNLFKPRVELAQLVFQQIKISENILTVNKDSSEIMSINQAAGKYAIKVSPLVFQLIEIAKQASLLPNSCFNLAIGPLVKLWKIGFTGQHIPTKTEIQTALQYINPEDIQLNSIAQTVFLTKANMQIDLGAIAKGYIADIIKKLLIKQGVEHALLNLGGNIITLGSSLANPNGTWQIGLQKPFASTTELLGIIQTKDLSIVTSGIYERYFRQDNQIYHHILDSKTGMPLNNELVGVSILSKSSLIGDIYSTIIYGLGLNAGLQYIAEKNDLEAIFVTRDKQIILSSANINFMLLDHSYQLTIA